MLRQRSIKMMRQQKLVEKAKKSVDLKSAVSTNAKGRDMGYGEDKEKYRSQRKYC